MQVRNNVKVLSANCQGLRNHEKRFDVLSYFKETKVNILCLQDTHLIETDIITLKKQWDGDIFLSGSKTNSRGVAILLNTNFEYKILETNIDKNGNFLNIVLQLSTFTINLITIYGPNTDNPGFFENFQSLLQNDAADYNIICGDFNLVLNPDLDTYNYRHLNNPNSRKAVLKIMKDNDLSDLYRYFHPETKRYTWRRKNPIKQARLDMFLASSNILDICNNCDIKTSYRSDHSAVELEIILNKFSCGKGIWKFNNSLLENPEYLALVNKLIEEEKQKYAVPIYTIEYIRNNYSDIQLTIDPDTFLEVLVLRIRGESIKFATHEKQKRSKLESNLINDIKILESSETLHASNMDLLEDKKQELENIRKVKMKGKSVRSRLQWLQEGEKPSKFFCNLENKNYIDKTIKKLQLNNGSIITEQEEVLHHVRNYYAKLFQSKDRDLGDVNFEKLGLIKNNKIAVDQDLGAPLNVIELGNTLKK